MLVACKEGIDQGRRRQETWRFEATTRLSNQFTTKESTGASSGNQNSGSLEVDAIGRVQQISSTQSGWRNCPSFH